jgi:hypothetical protein
MNRRHKFGRGVEKCVEYTLQQEGRRVQIERWISQNVIGWSRNGSGELLPVWEHNIIIGGGSSLICYTVGHGGSMQRHCPTIDVTREELDARINAALGNVSRET